MCLCSRIVKTNLMIHSPGHSCSVLKYLVVDLVVVSTPRPVKLSSLLNPSSRCHWRSVMLPTSSFALCCVSAQENEKSSRTQWYSYYVLRSVGFIIPLLSLAMPGWLLLVVVVLRKVHVGCARTHSRIGLWYCALYSRLFPILSGHLALPQCYQLSVKS